MMERLRSCFSRYGAGPAFPTKAERIMSRYRPIAPKPVQPCVSDVERSASSAVTFDNLCIRQVPDVSMAISTPNCPSKQKSKRVRKRLTKGSEGQQPTKRVALDALSSEASGKPQSFRGLSYGFSTETAPILIQEDAGFMERAAASAPPSVFPLEKARKPVQTNNCGYGGCFTEMIRGIAGLPTANHVHNLFQHQQQPQHQSPDFPNALPQQPSIVQPFKQLHREAQGLCKGSEVRDSRKDEVCSDAFWSCFLEGAETEFAVERAVSEEEQQSGLDEVGNNGENDQRKNIVTLNLLPEAPLRAGSPTTSSSSDASHTSAASTSITWIEQVYGDSSESVVLTDDANHKVLWVNQAYLKACKGNSNMVAPFIDPLGVPTQLGRFQLQLEGQAKCTSATLWGFLKKFVVDMAKCEAPRWFLSQLNLPLFDGKGESNTRLPCVPQQHSYGMLNCSSSHSLETPKVITPQPVRLVGSVVNVESVSEIQNGDAMRGALEHVKKQLEEGDLPGFIADASNVVRWVNTAYKVMVGQPKCSWLVSTMKEGGGVSPTIAGEVLLSCNVEVPTSAVSFSGRSNVQWTRNTGERSSMTLPCDVSVFIDDYLKRMLVWRFDIQASLSLTCGAERVGIIRSF